MLGNGKGGLNVPDKFTCSGDGLQSFLYDDVGILWAGAFQ